MTHIIRRQRLKLRRKVPRAGAHVDIGMEMTLGWWVSGPPQALRACHWATAVRGWPIMSFQCFTSAGPLFHER